MLQKPDLQDDVIIAALQNEYGLLIARLTFLPLGADRYAAVYRALAQDGRSYFIKLKRGAFDETSPQLLKFLSDQAIAQIIAPLITRTGHLWTGLQDFTLLLYPFIEGQNGYQVNMSDDQWRDLGRALHRIHTLPVPQALRTRIRHERYSPHWCADLKTVLASLANAVHADPIAAELAASLAGKRAEILDLVQRVERLAQELVRQSPPFVLCHSDVHAGNVLLAPGGALYIVDWDEPILAPKERDLMFVGDAMWGNWRTPQEEETPFYQGYGQAQIDPVALAYYRYERIVEDIALFCEQIFQTDESQADRQRSLGYVKSNFLPGETIEIAYRSDKTLWRA